MAASDPAARGRLPTLDGWRAVAVSCVLVYHTPELVYGYGGAKLGELGVSLFFSLSGLLIGLKLLADERRDGRLRVMPFVVGRLFRLLPALAVCLGVLVVLNRIGLIVAPDRGLLGALLGVSNYWPGGLNDGWFVAHFWSLAVEWQFYLLLPPLMLAAGSSRRIWFPFLAVACIVWRAFVVRYGLAAWYQAGDFPSPTWLTDTRLDGFLWGLVAAGWVDRRGWPAANGVARALAWLLFPAALAVNFATSSVNLRLTAFAVIFPAMLVASVAQHRPGATLSRILDAAPVRWLGNIGYSLYLYQQLFLAPVALRTFDWIHDWPWSWCAALVAAAVSYYAVERPMIAVGRRLTGRRKRDEGSAAPPQPGVGP